MGEPRDLDLLAQLRAEVANLVYNDTRKLDALERRADMLIRNVFTGSSKYLNDLRAICFYPSVGWSGMNNRYYQESWEQGKTHFLNLIDTMMEELALFRDRGSDMTEEGQSGEFLSNSVFLVHGHDEEMKQAVARVLEKLGLKTIILHEQPTGGRTIIEKLMDYGSVASFAVVLLSPDDFVHGKDEDTGQGKFRARQNVIFELGFFIGKLGRTRVLAIFRETKGFDIPSDYSGVLFTTYDDRGTWRFELVRELKAAGYAVDADKLL